MVAWTVDVCKGQLHVRYQLPRQRLALGVSGCWEGFQIWDLPRRIAGRIGEIVFVCITGSCSVVQLKDRKLSPGRARWKGASQRVFAGLHPQALPSD